MFLDNTTYSFHMQCLFIATRVAKEKKLLDFNLRFFMPMVILQKLNFDYHQMAENIFMISYMESAPEMIKMNEMK